MSGPGNGALHCDELRGIKSEMSDHHPVTCRPAKSEVEVGGPAVPVRFLEENKTRAPNSWYCLYAGEFTSKRPIRGGKSSVRQVPDEYRTIGGNWRLRLLKRNMNNWI